MALDNTVKIFDQFYNTPLVVNGNEYDIVYSFFKQYTSEIKTAKSFTETLFRISNITNQDVLTLLQTFEAGDKMKVALTMAYYLNTVNSTKAVMFGVANLLAPAILIQRNIVE